jgi:hypothetical protein
VVELALLQPLAVLLAVRLTTVPEMLGVWLLLWHTLPL